jgi:hypothetical protein
MGDGWREQPDPFQRQRIGPGAKAHAFLASAANELAGMAPPHVLFDSSCR